ncbi:HupE/UreJ protein [Rippkaea orientalis PCC 8801]|uniref:HupE/UreJ protein n=1 Tax=Rippkaea orientalis (strain PCC 8801 / RF-1) TaxID=41431 RepID=B7JZY0_RIPO1|nr:HupE/UreJ family protein [Rippkaea orientalis]ACK66127.1 HupE/UreJ protein [Rippkaea orientalis PCC 8801]
MKLSLIKNQGWVATGTLISLASLLLFIQPATAHHPFGGTTPVNLIEGFLSGLGHPIIGLDHFAFVVAAGLLGARLKQGWLIPLAFVLATMLGTGVHLQQINLPFPELIIALSVLIFGAGLVVSNNSLMTAHFLTITALILGFIAGIFHGYVYGETIIGSEMTPLVAYLMGFSLIQLIISLGMLQLGKVVVKREENQGLLLFKMIGFTISAFGLVLLSSAMI